MQDLVPPLSTFRIINNRWPSNRPNNIINLTIIQAETESKYTFTHKFTQMEVY